MASRAGRGNWSSNPRMTLSLAQVENNWAALGHAERLGLCPTDTLDIHFDRGDLFDLENRARRSLGEFLKSARQWVERKGERTAYIWTLENRGGGDGVHAHVLIHVPPAIATRFHQLKPRWARKAGLNMAIANVINREPLPTLKAAKGKLKYMSKDLDPRHWPLFHAGDRAQLHDNGKPSTQPIYGKKTGVSRNIDAKARASFHTPLALTS